MDAAFLSTRQVMRITSLSKSEVCAEIRRGHLDGTKYGQRWRVTHDSVQRWIDEKTEEAREHSVRVRLHDYKLLAAGMPSAQTTTARGGRGSRALMAVLGGGKQNDHKKLAPRR